MAPPPLKIDASNRGDHSYLREEHECYFFYEYSAGKGFGHSDGNNIVYNLKKSVLLEARPEYFYKTRAIGRCGTILRAVFEKAAWVYRDATIAAIPPSKALSDPEYDDRMTQILRIACAGKSADVRDIVRQTESYDASHTQPDGARKKTYELEAMYQVFGVAPRPTVILVDDVLTTGAHFVAMRNVILSVYPDRRVVGFFIARRVPANPFADSVAL